MKRTHPPGAPARFDAQVRHYHRSGGKPAASWDEWIDGKPARSGTRWNWLKITLVGVAILALIGIAAGLVIELGLL